MPGAKGISSVPAVVVNCGPPVGLEDYDSVESFDRALRERIACEGWHRLMQRGGASPLHGR